MRQNRNYPPPQTVSCIVPVYEARNVIGRCIDSLLAQTYRHIEIIIIDDGSTDGSSQICDEYAKVDKRVTVFHQENSGVSKARNEGLKHAIGDRIMFVDADDEVSPTLVEYLIGENADWVVGGFRNNHCTIALKQNRYISNEIPGFYATHFHRLYSTVPWGKLYRRSIITNYAIAFDSNIRLGEDLIFNLQYLLRCNSVAAIHTSGYIYHQAGIGAERYRLKLQEIRYTIGRVDECLSDLKKKFCTEFDGDAIKHTLVSTYPLSLILDGQHEEYKGLYCDTFPDKTEADYLNDYLCSPVIRGIHYIKNMIKTGRFKESYRLMRKIHQFESNEKMAFNIKTLTIKNRLIYFCYKLFV